MAAFPSSFEAFLLISLSRTSALPRLWLPTPSGADGFDDESDTDMDSEGVETGEGRQGLQRRATACGGGNVHGLEEGVDEATSDSSGRYEGDGEEEEEEEVEQEGAFGGGGGDGGGGVSLADPTSIDNEQQLQVSA